MTTTSIKDLNNVLQSLQVTENQLSILELWTRSYVHGVILKRKSSVSTFAKKEEFSKYICCEFHY